MIAYTFILYSCGDLFVKALYSLLIHEWEESRNSLHRIETHPNNDEMLGRFDSTPTLLSKDMGIAVRG